jgi:hypothetical protein
MNIRTILETLQAYMYYRPCFGVYLSCNNDDVGPEEMHKAVPLMSKEQAHHLWMEGNLFLEFETEDSAREFFDSVVGDDGPTKTNSYNGPARVFALWGEPRGWLSENT